MISSFEAKVFGWFGQDAIMNWIKPCDGLGPEAMGDGGCDESMMNVCDGFCWRGEGLGL